MSTRYTPTFTTDDVEVLEQETAYHGYFKIERYRIKHKLFKGGWSQPLLREVFERGYAVAVLLFDPIHNKVVMIEQFRMGAYNRTKNPWLLELVAGIIDQNETPEQVAIRETEEEAGLVISDLIPMYDYWVSPGGSMERVALFCAQVDATLAGGIHGLPEEGEDIRVWTFDLAEAYEFLAKGIVVNGITIIALQWLQLNEKKVRAHFKK